MLSPRSLALVLCVSVPTTSAAVSFVEVTNQAGVAYDHGWVEGREDLMPKLIAGGVAAGDFDRDGDVDLFVVRGNLAPAALYRNRGDGTFIDVADAAGVAIATEHGLETGPAFADLDGDGWLDLLVGGVLGTQPRLFRNLGDGSFMEATDAAGLAAGRENTYSAAFADWDEDGDLDLFLSHWTMADDCGAGACDSHLWVNDGAGSFTAVDLAAQEIAWSDDDYTFAPNFADLDSDGLLDLVIASDFGDSRVLRNLGDGAWQEITDPHVIIDQNGMGAAVGDYDNDGHLDWFVSSIYNEVTGKYGNRLYRGLGDGSFADVTDTAGVAEGFWGWGACMADFDNDGHLDIFHVNGWISEPTDPARLFMSNGDGTFAESSMELGLDERPEGRGVVCFDHDRDGDIDIFVATNSGGSALWRNDGGNDNHWLTVTLVAPGGNTQAVGARLHATAGGTTWMRELRAGSNFESQDPTLAHFGLADATAVDELAIIWPDDTASRHFALPADTSLQIQRLFGDPRSVTYTRTPWRFDPCSACQLDATLEIGGLGGGGPIQARLLGWVESGQTNVSLTFEPDADRLVFRQWEDNVLVGRVNHFTAIDEGIAYDVAVDFDGTDFRVWLDGTLVIQTPSRSSRTPSGFAALTTRDAEVTVHNIAATTTLVQ